jgi:hypothetical protein
VDQEQGRKERGRHGAYNLSALAMSLSGSDEELDMIAATNSLSRPAAPPPPRFRRQLVRSAEGGEAKQPGRDETRQLPFGG